MYALDRVTLVQRLLEAVGVEPERVRMFNMSAAEPDRFVKAAWAVDKAISALPRLAR
jgi:coenzyme F420-reducing hydrogenase delta subunit